MKVKGVKDGLEKLLPVLEAWEAKKVARDFEKLIELMDGHEEMTVDAFCKKARQGLEGKAAGGGNKAAALRQEVVDAHVAALREAVEDDGAFDAALDAVASDKQVRLKELKTIAAGFMELTPLKTKKADLLNEMKSKRAQDLRTKHKFKILSNW